MIDVLVTGLLVLCGGSLLTLFLAFRIAVFLEWYYGDDE